MFLSGNYTVYCNETTPEGERQELLLNKTQLFCSPLELDDCYIHLLSEGPIRLIDSSLRAQLIYADAAGSLLLDENSTLDANATGNLTGYGYNDGDASGASDGGQGGRCGVNTPDDTYGFYDEIYNLGDPVANFSGSGGWNRDEEDNRGGGAIVIKAEELQLSGRVGAVGGSAVDH